MGYHLIQPPFTLEFSKMSKDELLEYFDWFKGMLDGRIAELAAAIQVSPGFESWRPDRTRASLDMSSTNGDL